MSGMNKNTVYIPKDIKRVLRELAATRGVSQAELIREVRWAITAKSVAPRPTLPLFRSGKPNLAERSDWALRGFGKS
jgi:hypothetical protein